MIKTPELSLSRNCMTVSNARSKKLKGANIQSNKPSLVFPAMLFCIEKMPPKQFTPSPKSSLSHSSSSTTEEIISDEVDCKDLRGTDRSTNPLVEALNGVML